MKEAIIKELNLEIERLTRARNVLLGGNFSRGGTVRRRRPMSPATKAKIGAAMAKRWAARGGKKREAPRPRCPEPKAPIRDNALYQKDSLPQKMDIPRSG